MKKIRKPVSVLLIVLAAVMISACSQNTYSSKRNYGHASVSNIDPVSHKKYPLKKNYIIPVKRKPILGLQKPKI